MKKIKIFLFATVTFFVFSSHDMFLKFDNYFLKPNTESLLQLFNGTFEKSDNSIERNRMLDVSLVGNGNRTVVDSSLWFVKDSITFLKFKTGNPGTWIAGVSTKPRNFEMKAEKFNDYLKNDGVIDVLEKRKITNTLNEDAFEKYSKHVKTIFQIGSKLSDDWNVNLGYPIEFIPLENPYEIHTGHHLPIKLLRNGKPLPNHFVYVGHKPNNVENQSHGDAHEHGDKHKHKHSDSDQPHEHNKETHTHTHKGESVAHSHGNHVEKHSHQNENEMQNQKTTSENAHVHDEVLQLKTDANGIVNVNITAEGIWFLRTIDMVELNDDELTHESNWATLTFAIGSGLGHSHDDAHKHEHDDEGFPSYLFWIGSIILVGILFLFFNRKK